jgi:hypothetical protein
MTVTTVRPVVPPGEAHQTNGLVHPHEVPPPTLESGDRLTRAEFERRYHARPDIKKAELIEGVVYVASPIRVQQHGEPHSHIIVQLIFGLATWRVCSPYSSKDWRRPNMPSLSMNSPVGGLQQARDFLPLALPIPAPQFLHFAAMHQQFIECPLIEDHPIL